MAGVAGALAWAAVAYFVNLEVGYLAWGIGLLVGYAVLLAEGRGPIAGAAAAAITIVSLLAGKYLSVELLVQKEMAAVQPVNEELVVSYVADEVVADYESAGKPVAWPVGVDPGDASTEADYPADVWSEATNRWAAMPEDERQSRTQFAQQQLDQFVAVFANQARQDGFFATFSAFDFLFFGLGVVTAFRLPSSAEDA